jgi:hypothetical protein
MDDYSYLSLKDYGRQSHLNPVARVLENVEEARFDDGIPILSGSRGAKSRRAAWSPGEERAA